MERDSVWLYVLVGIVSLSLLAGIVMRGGQMVGPW